MIQDGSNRTHLKEKKKEVISYKYMIYIRGKNSFVTATELGTTNNFFGAATKNFAATTKRFVDRINILL